MVKIELGLALEAGIIRRADYTNAYIDAVEKLIDMQAIREAEAESDRRYREGVKLFRKNHRS